MSLLSTDIHELPLRLNLGNSAPVEATLFLHSHGPRGQEGLLERLNGPESFLPFRWEGRIHLVARSAIRWIESEERAAADPELPDRMADPLHLQMRMRDGRILSGSVQALLPSHRNRLSDFLNLEDGFFALATREGSLVVNKDWIESVEPLKDEL